MMSFKFFTHSCLKNVANGAKRRKHVNVLHETVWKMLKLTNKSKNREDIIQKQGKYQKITGKVTVYYSFSLTEFLPCFFQVECLPPGVGALLAKIFTLELNNWRRDRFFRRQIFRNGLPFCPMTTNFKQILKTFGLFM